MKGWLRLWRELASKPIWLNSSPEQKVILIALMMLANHEEKEWEWHGRQFKAEPGQFVTSIQSIIDTCGDGISSQNVRSALARFQRFEFLTDESTTMGRLITITNWKQYQEHKNETSPEVFPAVFPTGFEHPVDTIIEKVDEEAKTNIATNIASDKPLPQRDAPETLVPDIATDIATNRQVTDGSQSTNKEVTPTKNERTKEGSIYTPGFTSFWFPYPRKIEKRGAFACWNIRLKEGIAEEDLIRASVNYRDYCTRNHKEQEHIKYPATFLSRDRPFEDYLTSPTDRKDGDQPCPIDPELQRIRAMKAAREPATTV